MIIAILDDVKADRLMLSGIVSKYLQARNIEFDIRTYACAEELVSDAYKYNISVAFLDICMEGMSGFEAAELIRKDNESVPIVFVTTEKQFALDGYEVAAADFIVKPYNEQRIEKTLARVLKLSGENAAITIKEDRTEKQILLRDINYAETRGHYVEIHSKTRVYRSYMNFDEFCDKTAKYSSFQICHRGVIVNFDNVSRLEEQSFLMKNGERVPISRSKKTAVANSFAAYAFESTRGRL